MEDEAIDAYDEHEHDHEEMFVELPQPPRRSSRIPVPNKQWWIVDNRNPVHFAYRAAENLDDDPVMRKAARDKEIDTIRSYKTWKLGPKPNDRKAVGCKWVDTIKRDGMYKSRLVVRGFSQIEGVDFFDTFAPVAKPTTVRIFLVICNNKKMSIHQSDVTAAYLNGIMDEEIYMEQPPGYIQQGENGQKLYCKLLKALYGTKQAGRAWRKVIKEFLLLIGFEICVFDPCLFFKGSNDTLIIVIVWVDDLLTGYHGSNIDGFNMFWSQLAGKFNVTSLGMISDYVGMNITHDIERCEMRINQRENIRKMLRHFEMENASERYTPLNTNWQLTGVGAEVYVDKPYRSLIGCLLYPTQWTRPDISYAIGSLSQYKTTSTSTTMAELEALYHAVTEGIWIYEFLKSFGLVLL